MLVLCAHNWVTLLMVSDETSICLYICTIGALVGQSWWYSNRLYTNVLRGINCVGNETSLNDCPRDSSASCGYSNYHATVICPGLISFFVKHRLITFNYSSWINIF